MRLEILQGVGAGVAEHVRAGQYAAVLVHAAPVTRTGLIGSAGRDVDCPSPSRLINESLVGNFNWELAFGTN